SAKTARTRSFGTAIEDQKTSGSFNYFDSGNPCLRTNDLRLSSLPTQRQQRSRGSDTWVSVSFGNQRRMFGVTETARCRQSASGRYIRNKCVTTCLEPDHSRRTQR